MTCYARSFNKPEELKLILKLIHFRARWIKLNWISDCSNLETLKLWTIYMISGLAYNFNHSWLLNAPWYLVGGNGLRDEEHYLNLSLSQNYRLSLQNVECTHGVFAHHAWPLCTIHIGMLKLSLMQSIFLNTAQSKPDRLTWIIETIVSGKGFTNISVTIQIYEY